MGQLHIAAAEGGLIFMKLTPRQKKEAYAFSILLVLIILLVIANQYHINKFRERKLAVISWSPEKTLADFQQDISPLPLKNDTKESAEKCFQEGAELLRQARVLLDRNQFKKAKEAFNCADTLASTFSTSFNLGLCSFYLEDFSLAAGLFLKSVNTRPDAYEAESFLGLCLANTGRWKEGMDSLSNALRKVRNRKDQLWEAVILSNIGVIYKHAGRSDDAEKYHDRSLVICQKIGYKRGEAGELVNLAYLVASRKRVDQAFKIFDNALAIYRKIGDGRGEAATLGYVAQLYMEQQNIADAVKYYEQSVAVSRRIGYHLGEAEALMELGVTTYWQNNQQKAISYYLQAEESYRKAGFSEGTSSLLGNLGLLYIHKKDYPKALEYYQRALELDRSTRYTLGEAHDLRQIGLIHEFAGNSKKALAAYRQARAVFESLQLNEQVKELDNRIRAASDPASKL